MLERLFGDAHEYANLANRNQPVAKDVLEACNDAGLTPAELRRTVARSSRKRKRNPMFETRLEPCRDSPPPPALLPSDDEGAIPPIPATLRALPSFYPSLPPKHTYLQTPIIPTKKAALPSLEKKLNTAGLVQDSLRNLLIGTEETTNQEDAELLGHIVNWESAAHPRKRWKVGNVGGGRGRGGLGAGMIDSGGSGSGIGGSGLEELDLGKSSRRGGTGPMPFPLEINGRT